MEAAHGDIIKVHYESNFIIRKEPARKDKVAVISGGGSGHEPMHGGFVGLGMLDAACPSEVFTLPTPGQMEAAAKAVDAGAGNDIKESLKAAADATEEGMKATIPLQSKKVRVAILENAA